MTTNVNFLPIDIDVLIQRTAEATATATVERLKAENYKKENPDELLLPKEACNVLRCSIPTLWRWEKSGKVKSHTIGGKRLYKRSDLSLAVNNKR